MSFFANMPPFTLFHTIISPVGIATGFLVVAAMLRGQRLKGWTAVFLAPTQSEPPFGITQGLVLLAFIVMAVSAVKRFHPRAADGSVAGRDARAA